MERVPGRIGVAGDWHGNTAWATRAVRKMAALLPADGPRVIVHLGDFGIWPGPGGQEYLARLDAALAEAGAELSFVDGNHEDFTQLGRLRPGPAGWRRVWGSGSARGSTRSRGCSPAAEEGSCSGRRG